jgi:hypothetical protein
MNRQFNPDADTSSWTPMEALSGKMLEWAEGKFAAGEKSGGLVRVVTEGGKTRFEIV